MVLATMAPAGTRATPTQNSTHWSMTMPMPPTTKPTRMIMTPVQAAGVLPW